MLFYEEKNISWILQAISIMEQNQDLLCVLPRGGPPTKDRTLQQGTTPYRVDEKEGFICSKTTSCHYLIHRERFLKFTAILNGRARHHSGYLGENRSKADYLEMVNALLGNNG